MPQSTNRSLEQSEARKILNIAQAAQIDKDHKETGKWPGTYNLRVLADAVNLRRSFVELEESNGVTRYKIRYDDDRKTVFVSPAGKDFIPCGWFSFESLKQVINISDE